MSRRQDNEEWERRKIYLNQSMFCDKSELSPIRRSPELSASPPHAVASASHEDDEPLNNLISKRPPKRPNIEINYKPTKKIRKYYNMLYNEERNGSSCSKFGKKFVHSSTPSSKSTSNDDNFESDFNIAFVEDKADSTELNKMDFSNNADKTNQLDQIQSVASKQFKSSDDEINDESTPVTRQTKEEKENYQNAAAEENNRLTLIQTEDKESEVEIATISSEISKSIDNVKIVKAIKESMLEENLNDANINQNKECLDSDNAKDKEMSSKDTKNDTPKATAERIASFQHITLSTEETNSVIFKVNEFREIAVQTDKIPEKNESVVDVGVQAKEKEKEVKSVGIQTDEDEGLFFMRQRMFGSGSSKYNFYFL